MTGAERAGSERASSQGADPVTSSTGTTGGAVARGSPVPVATVASCSIFALLSL
jgi:hypothetical protein